MLDLAKKFNRHHEAAGSPTGGQFTFGDSNVAARTPSSTSPRMVESSRADRSTVESTGLPHYGAPTAGAVSVVATHYSNEPRTVLSGQYYGRGLKGAERIRLQNEDADPRIKNRIYFYVDEGHGVRPESGVGAYPHKVVLDNLYDPTTDKALIWSKGKGDANASEKAVLDAGYDGYYVKNFANQAGVAVLLGDHHVPVLQSIAKDDAMYQTLTIKKADLSDEERIVWAEGFSSLFRQ